jgi:hypothetical protein
MVSAAKYATSPTNNIKNKINMINKLSTKISKNDIFYFLFNITVLKFESSFNLSINSSNE